MVKALFTGGKWTSCRAAELPSSGVPSMRSPEVLEVASRVCQNSAGMDQWMNMSEHGLGHVEIMEIA